MREIIISVKIFLLFTILTGIIYPMVITAIAQLAFPYQANGSLIRKGNTTIGSELIGQQFKSVGYFTSRPSAIEYNPLPSGGSNYGPTSIQLKQLVEERKNRFTDFNQIDSATFIPSEMLFASASGVDPHISKKAALLQVNRVAKARSFTDIQRKKLLACVSGLSESPQILILGKESVNVFLLNLEVDKIE